MVATRRSGIPKSISAKSPPKRSSKRATVTSNEASTLRVQLAEREQALASQEQRINELAAMVASMHPPGQPSNVGYNANTGPMNWDISGDLDVDVGAAFGLPPRTNEVPANNFSSHPASRTALTAPTPAPAPAPTPAPVLALDPALLQASIPTPALSQVQVRTVQAPTISRTIPGPDTHRIVHPAAVGGQPATSRANTAPQGSVPQTAENMRIHGQHGDILTKIPHPGGRVGRGCKLREAMRLNNNVKLYQEIHRKVLWAVAFANLPTNVYWYRQDQKKLLAVTTSVVDAFPYLKRFDPPSWPVTEMIKTLIRNKHTYRKRIDKISAQAGWGTGDEEGGFDDVPTA